MKDNKKGTLKNDWKPNWNLIILIISICFSQSLLNHLFARSPKALHGHIDLKNWDFDKNNFVRLDGEWEFYWNCFLMDSTSSSQETKKDYQNVPKLWNTHIIDGKEIGGQGFASYRLKVSLPSIEKYAIKYLNSATSCQIFIDGKLLFSSGYPAKTKQNTQPSYEPALIEFTPKTTTVEIVLQIANFHHKKGGQWESLTLGKSDSLRQHSKKNLFLELFFAGSIFFIGLFHLAIYIQYTKDKPSLYLALFSIFLVIKTLVSGEGTIYLLGDINWYLIIRSDYISFYLSILFFSLFIEKLFPKESAQFVFNAVLIIILLFSVSVIVLPPEYFSHGMIFFQIFTIMGAFYALYILFLAAKHKRTGAKLLLYGFLFLVISLLHDVLRENAILHTFALAPIGLPVFLLFNATILASRTRDALETNKKLSKKLFKQNKEYKELNEKYRVQNKHLHEANIKIEETDRLKSAFLANMSHEIRTPMNGILGFANILKEHEISADEQREYIEIIEESGHRMLNTINDLMDISKIEARQMKVFYKTTDVNQIIHKIFVFFNPEVQKKNLTLKTNSSLKGTAAIVKTDGDKLHAILTNLTKNAIKFTDQGQIEIACKLVDSYMEFHVADTGIGIPKEKHDSVFDRFVQADTNLAKSYEGTGLGLAISKGYIELLGGKIWLDSSETIGSKFTFTIPYQPLNATTHIQQVKEIKKESGLKFNDISLLVVEDEKIAREFMHKVLSNNCKELIFAVNGQEALTIFEQKQNSIDVILMDIKLPDIDGYSVTKKIRETNQKVPIIAQTAYTLFNEKEKALEVGCNDYISKPIDADLLISKINNLVGNKKNR